MSNKLFFRIGYIFLIIFILLGTYFWFVFFDNYTKDKTKNYDFQNYVKLISDNNITMINTEAMDNPDETIQSYLFHVSNDSEFSVKYSLLIQDIMPNSVNDGCSMDTLLRREDLNYELKENGKVIKNGLLSSIRNNQLYDSLVEGNETKNYELRVWIKANALDWKDKHYHYMINLRESM